MGVLSLVVFICIIFMIYQVEAGTSRPYIINYEKIEDCDDQGTKALVWYKNITKLENGNYNAGFYTKMSIDKSFKFCMEARELTTEGYTKIHQFNCKTCGQAWSLLSDYLTNLMIAAGVPTQKCVFPEGNYLLKNWDASQMKHIPVRIFKKFMVHIEYYDGNSKVGCNNFFVELVPK